MVLLKTAMDKVYEIQVLKFGERRNQRLSWIFAGLWIVTMVAAAYFTMR